ncbi:MAG: FHA domain-containing protein [Pseudomonadota bacterium]
MPLVIDLNDADIGISDGQGHRARMPGFALLSNNAVEVTGERAERSARLHPRRIQMDYWYRLDTQTVPNFAPLTRADVAASQLRELLEPFSADTRHGAIVVPPYMSRETLGLLQGLCQAVDFRLIALVDAATAATRQHYVDAVPLHVEFGLHCVWVAKMRQTANSSALEDVQILEGSGLLALHDAWMRWFAAEFVRQSRFDPLHSAPSEQALFDALPNWLAGLEGAESQTLSLTVDGGTYAIEVEMVDVVNVVFEHYQRLADLARAMLASGESPVFQMRDRTTMLPGLAELLVTRVGGIFVAQEDDSMLTGVLSRLSAIGENPSRIVRELPVQGEVVGVVNDDAPAHGVPTHILLGDRAYPLSADAVIVGGGGAPGLARYLAIESGLAGVSSIHCEVSVEGGQCLLIDRSRYGTFLNGSRISGSATLRAGDTVRVGTPGQELHLIREEAL